MSHIGLPASEFARHAGEATILLKALGNQCRLLVLCHLAKSGELSIAQLTDRVGMDRSALSEHLASLREEGLLVTRKEARTVRYSLCDAKAEQLLAFLHDLFCPELGRENEPNNKGR